jgi:DNA-directed RNA polymerase subunit RPC12/RpoP
MGIEYDAHTDSIYYVPECWCCGSPLSGLEESDIGTEIECPDCERKIRIPDVDWIRKYIEENSGLKGYGTDENH